MIHPVICNPVLNPVVRVTDPVRWRAGKLAPDGAILHFDADIDPYAEQTGGVHTFNHAVLSPQYRRGADGSYTDVGAKPAVDVFDGEKWLRSCGAVNNISRTVAALTYLSASLVGEKLTPAATSAVHLAIIYGAAAVGTQYYVSGVFKAAGVRYVKFVQFANNQNFDLELGAVGTGSGFSSATIESLGGGYYRCSAFVTPTTAAPLSFELSPNGNAHWDDIYLGVPDNGILMRDWMLTATSYPVPYVPPGVTQPASNATTTNGSWFANPKYVDKVAGAGVGPCPESVLPPLMVPMDGHDDPTSPNYGTYVYDGVADMCFIPRFYYKVNNTLGYTYGTHGVNTITIRGSETFSSTAAANIAGFALHRAFIDGGVEHAGFFVDKYKCSKVAKGTGYVAGSVKNGNPLSTAANHNPIAEITSAGANNYAACIDAAKGRDGIDGARNDSSIFAPISVYQRSALALFSLGYGEAATESDYCAWYDATGLTNFPKGCNNNALRDTNDSQVVYQSDGYSNCGKTGSGTPFERTTHNGQACGVADLSGLLWEVSIGMTCSSTTKSIAGATQANPCVLTVPGHGLTTGRIIQVTSVVGMTQLNDKLYTVTVIDPDTISLDGVNSTGFTAYASAGSVTYGQFYAAKESTRMRDFTSGATLATDHWGATGVAAMMDEVALPMAAEPGGSSMTRYVGSGALSSDTAGPGYILTGIGHPTDVASIAVAGVDLFGKDYIYQYIRDQMCVRSGGHWSSGSGAGVFARALDGARSLSSNNVGLRCACYPATENDPTAIPPSILGSKVRSVSPLWSALASDEVVGSPLTIATRVRMGVWSGDLANSSVLNVLTPDDVAGRFLTIQNDGSGNLSAKLSDGTNTATVPMAAWSRGDVLDFFPQVLTGGTQMRIGYKTKSATSITWGSAATYVGTFGPDSALKRLIIGFANAYPVWHNKITAWKKQASDAEILEAMA